MLIDYLIKRQQRVKHKKMAIMASMLAGTKFSWYKKIYYDLYLRFYC